MPKQARIICRTQEAMHLLSWNLKTLLILRFWRLNKSKYSVTEKYRNIWWLCSLPRNKANDHIIALGNVIMLMGSKSIDYVLGLWGAFNRGCSSAMPTPPSFTPFGKRKACFKAFFIFGCTSISFKNALDSMTHPKHGRVLSFLELSHDMSNVGESGCEKSEGQHSKIESAFKIWWKFTGDSWVGRCQWVLGQCTIFDFSLSFSWNWPTLQLVGEREEP